MARSVARHPLRILSRFVKTFHFHRRPDERSNALGIVADAGLADVVLGGAGAVGTAAEALDLAGVFQADVTRSGVDFDEVLEHAVIPAARGRSVFAVEVAEASPGGEGVYEHARCRGFEVVA